jgi:hypothetical protein
MTLRRRERDNINRMITITGFIYIVMHKNETHQI